MKPHSRCLLGQRFAPLTDQVGFLAASFDRTLDVFLRWQMELGAKLGRRPQYELLKGPLSDALEHLQPLTTPPSKVLLIETSSRWTAFFDNGLRMSDPESPVGHLCTIVPCKGVVAHCAPDRSNTEDPDALRIYGIVSLKMFTTHPTEWLNQERAIVAMNDGGSWLFSTSGVEQPFEESEKYNARQIVDRFTDELLERYCAALGIGLFDEIFYGGKAAVISTIQRLAPGAPKMSLEEARRHTVALPISSAGSAADF
jgi:hypothetical protein